MKILFTGGGTAGHIFPIVAIIREMKKIHPRKKVKFFYVGPNDQFALSLLSKEGVEIKEIMAGKLRRYFSFQNIIDIFFKFPIGIIQSFFHIFSISPDIIFSKGGYGSLPVVIAGWILQTPIFLHESDVVSGLSNKIAFKFSLGFFTAFPVRDKRYYSAQRVIAAGNPIRRAVLSGSPEKAKRIFQLKGGKPVVLILGGSQGAQRINDRILTVLPDLLENFELIHQTGKRHFDQVRKEAGVIINKSLMEYYHAFPFLDEVRLANAYEAADLVISRAGAGSIFEIAAVGKPSVLVPLARSAQNHQVRNSYAYAQEGAAIVMEEANFTSHFLLTRLKFLFSKPKKLKQMAQSAKVFSRPESARVIAEYIVAYLNQ